MASAEYNIESLVIAILQASATFTSVPVEHHVEDEATTEKGSRLTVKAENATPKVGPSRPNKKAPVWESVVTINVQHAGTDTEFDTWRAAIDAAMMPATYPAPVITSANSLFPNGIIIESANGGVIFDASEKRRKAARTFPVVFIP